MHFGPDDVLLNPSLDFKDDITANDIEAAIIQLERAIRKARPEIKRVFIEAQSRGGHLRAEKAESGTSRSLSIRANGPVK